MTLQENETIWNIKVAFKLIEVGALGTTPKGLVKGLGRLGNKRINRDHIDYSIIKISQNNEKRRGDLRRRAGSGNPWRNHGVKKYLVGR